MEADPNRDFKLDRFVHAQDPVYSNVLSELRAERKTSHWMWFIFPQLRGLGFSAMAWEFGIVSIDEARAYLAHPTLGSRLLECTGLVNATHGKSIEEILGAIDAMKFRSSMTLFREAAPGPTQFTKALEKYFGGAPDPLTVERLR